MRNLGLGARKTPHLLLAKTPEFSSPPGEGVEARPFEEIDTAHSPLGLGYEKVSQERGKSGVPLEEIDTAHALLAPT